MLWFLFLVGFALGDEAPSGATALDEEAPTGAMALNVAPVILQSGSCPQFWFNFKGRCYNYVATPMTWADAEVHCVSEKANLVSIYSQEEQKFINSLTNHFDPLQGFTWIGLTDNLKAGKWIWSDGCPMDFSDFATGEPSNTGGNEHCVHTNFEGLQEWNDNKCHYTFPFVCATRVMCP